MTGEGKAMLGNSISGVIFDLDGTLADTSPDIAAALNAALREAGQKPLPVPDVITMIGGGIPTLVKRAIARLGASRSLQDVMVERMLYHYNRDYCVHSELMIGVADCLDALQERGLPMAICTNKDQVIARKIVTALGIEPYVMATVGRQPDISKKPDPAMLNLAAEQIGCAVDSIVIVGDSDVDATTAQAAGACSVIVRNGYFSGDYETIGADFIIEDMTCLMPLMSKPGDA